MANERDENVRGGLDHVPTGELVRRLIADSERLVHDDLMLVRAELKRDVRDLAAGGLVLGVGATLALGGFLVLCFTAVYLLALVIPLWVAGLVVGLGLSGAGGLLGLGGARQAAKVRRQAHDTAETLEKEAAWVSAKLH